MKKQYVLLKEMIQDSKQIVLFTGAGISVPSGIPDFRSENGIYQQKENNNISPEEIISHSFFLQNPEQFYRFYKSKMCYPKATYNIAHKYFADLEKKGKNVIVITQNIDGLHQKAGSSIVYELHGTIHQNFCTKCGTMFGLEKILNAPDIPLCEKCGSIIKPNVVLYEEGLDEDIVSRSIHAIMSCDMMIVVGTSLKVYPAAGFIRYFKGKYLVLINKETTSYDMMCDLTINEDICEVIKNII